MFQAWHLWVVYVNVTLYVICFMALSPLMPYLVDRFTKGSGDNQYARLQTFFSAIQFVGGLLSGPFIDHYGGRAALIVSFASSFVCYSLTACASGMGLLYLSRVPTVMQHAVLAARTIVVSGSAAGPERARVLGHVSMALSVGFVLGPAIGGLLSGISLQFTAWVAAAGSVLSLVSVAVLLPGHAPSLPAPAAPLGVDGSGSGADGDAVKVDGGGGATDAGGGGTGAGDEDTSDIGVEDDDFIVVNGTAVLADHFGTEAGHAVPAIASATGLVLEAPKEPPFWTSFVEVSRQPGIPVLLAVKALASLGPAIWQSMFPVLMLRQFGLSPRANGLVLSFVGFVNILCQGFVVAPMVAWLGEPRAAFVSIVAMMFSFGGLACVVSLWQLLVLLVPLCAASSLFSTLNTAQLTKAVPSALNGTILAIDMSLFSGVRMLSPSIGAYLMASLGPASVCATAALLDAVLVALMYFGAAFSAARHDNILAKKQL